MLKNVIRECMFRPKRCGQNKRDLVLPNHIAGALPHTGFGSAIGDRLKTERALIKMRRLLGITDVKLDVIGPFQRQKIFLFGWSLFGFGNSNCSWHNDLLTLSRQARLSNIRLTSIRRKVARLRIRGAHAPSRAGERALAIANFRPWLMLRFVGRSLWNLVNTGRAVTDSASS